MEVQNQPKVNNIDESGNLHKAIAELTEKFDGLEKPEQP